MTAELCDCFETRREGVVAVLDAVVAAFPDARLGVWSLDGRFQEPTEIRARPLQAAAANWLALATVAARLAGEAPGLLVDIGSTTTDLIPFRDGRVVAVGRTDTERLQTGELVYAGVRRTPVATLATSLPLRGVDTGLAAELFATTLDVYLTLGPIPEDPGDRDTADGRPATIAAARQRLARMVGADGETFSPGHQYDLALAAHEALMARLVAAAQRAARPLDGGAEVVVVSGAGEFLGETVARTLAPRSTRVRLAERWGRAASTAACARALLELTVGPETPL
jgi:probable H4MPT-linked C1 transfer pathway protein